MAIEKLTDLQVRKAKPGMLGDGGGLYLLVARSKDGESVNKSWIFRFTRNGKTRDMGLGSLAALTLADARDRAQECRRLLGDGIDPIDQRDAKKAADLASSKKNTATFEECTTLYLAQHRAGWKTTGYERDWKNSLATYAYPHIGKLDVALIDVPNIRLVLDPIWSTKPVLAGHVRERIEAVIDLASTSKFRSGENPARWRGHLAHLYPKVSKIHTKKHYAALPWKEAPGFMPDLRAVDSIPARALEFLILSAVRGIDVRRAKVDGIDLKERVWVIPDRSKNKKREPIPHRVPLTDAAIEVLTQMQTYRETLGGAVKESAYLFPSPEHGGMLGRNAMLDCAKGFGYQITAHGFRSTFDDWCSESTHFARELKQVALIHVVGSETDRSYQRGDLFDKRVLLMRAWANYLAKPVEDDGKVIDLYPQVA
jgi:integrase